MNKIDKLKSEIKDIKAGISSPTTPDKFKDSLKDVLKEKEAQLEELMKSDKSSTSTITEKNKPSATASGSAKTTLAKCQEILARYNKQKRASSKRVEKRAKQGKPAILTPGETVRKSATAVKSKVVQMKEKTDEGLSASEIQKISSGIVATVKSTLSGILTNAGKQKFLRDLVNDLSELNKGMTKVAMEGGVLENGGQTMIGGTEFSSQDLSGMFDKGGSVNYGRAWTLDHNQHNKSESYEVPKSERKKKFEDGGITMDEYLEKKKYTYDEGGYVDQNADMLMAKVNQIGNSISEISKIVGKNTEIEAWVLARAERSATDLTDIKNHLDSRKDMFAKGGTTDRINEMVNHWHKEGWVNSNLSNDDSEFFKRISKTPMEVSTTSFTGGNSVFYYDDERVEIKTGGFRKKLIGKTIMVSAIGDKTPSTHKITDVQFTNPKFTSKFLILGIDGKGEERIPLSKTKNFYDNEEVELKNSKGEPYTIKLVEKLEEGGMIMLDTFQRINTPDFADPAQYAKGGMLEHGLQLGDSIISDIGNNTVMVKNETEPGVMYYVNLNTGERSVAPYEKGGKTTDYRSQLEEMGDEELAEEWEYETGVSKEDALQDMEDERDTYIDELVRRNSVAMKSRGEKMSKGGKVSFSDKVKSISNSLKGKKVPPKYQKKYGKTYDKKESLESAKRIAGAMKAKSKKKG